jgi:hypothetical protein
MQNNLNQWFFCTGVVPGTKNTLTIKSRTPGWLQKAAMNNHQSKLVCKKSKTRRSSATNYADSFANWQESRTKVALRHGRTASKLSCKGLFLNDPHM